MKSFNEIYGEIYKEYNKETEVEDVKEKNTKISKGLIILVAILGFFILPQLFAIALVLLLIKAIFKQNKRRLKFKQKAIVPLIKNMDENLTYYPEKGLSSALYREGEFEGYDLYSTEDLIMGKLDGKYDIKMAEVHTQNESEDSDGNRTTTTVFCGMFGNIECSKNVQGTLKVHSDKGFFGKIFKGKTKLKMDSADFEKYFDIYADNKIIAMQILTSDVMALMIDFIEQSKIKYELTIKENQMYIRFHTGGMFEPGMFKKGLDYDRLKRYYDILEFVFKVTREINKAIDNAEI